MAGPVDGLTPPGVQGRLHGSAVFRCPQLFPRAITGETRPEPPVCPPAGTGLPPVSLQSGRVTDSRELPPGVRRNPIGRRSGEITADGHASWSSHGLDPVRPGARLRESPESGSRTCEDDTGCHPPQHRHAHPSLLVTTVTATWIDLRCGLRISHAQGLSHQDRGDSSESPGPFRGIAESRRLPGRQNTADRRREGGNGSPTARRDQAHAAPLMAAAVRNGGRGSLG